jgi:hypothetical protein
MNAKIKSLILGIDALNRLTLDVDGLEPDTIPKMTSAQDIVNFLVDHPQARMSLGYFSISVESPNFEDVDHERYDAPFEINAAVEDFSKSRSGDGWCCQWALG